MDMNCITIMLLHVQEGLNERTNNRKRRVGRGRGLLEG
uniref:Uncharacterized protein n=1 Tax=Rhizophora mucronata TaxID=61149 RepID=A0A2P2NAS7_RHIMU